MLCRVDEDVLVGRSKAFPPIARIIRYMKKARQHEIKIMDGPSTNQAPAPSPVPMVPAMVYNLNMPIL